MKRVALTLGLPLERERKVDIVKQYYERIQTMKHVPPRYVKDGPILENILTGDAIDVPVDQLLIRMGLSPRLGPIHDWGLALERKQLVVDTARFQTAETGLYAVGDIVTYPGKRKLLLSGFHEATLAAFAARSEEHTSELQSH